MIIQIFDIVTLEIEKLFKRRTVLIVFLTTLFGFPFLLSIATSLQSRDPGAIQGLFVEQAAEVIILANLFVVCLPIWIALFVGQELSNGHVNRIVFLTSRKYYFFAKIVYCVTISVFFSFLSTLTLLLSVKTSNFSDLSVGFKFTFLYFIQLLLINTLYSLVVLCITFALRRPLVCIIASYLLPQLESFIFFLFYQTKGINLSWLPFRLISSLYTDSIKPQDIRYVNPIINHPSLTIAPIILVVSICYLSYKWFSNRDLMTLSD